MNENCLFIHCRWSNWYRTWCKVYFFLFANLQVILFAKQPLCRVTITTHAILVLLCTSQWVKTKILLSFLLWNVLFWKAKYPTYLMLQLSRKYMKEWWKYFFAISALCTSFRKGSPFALWMTHLGRANRPICDVYSCKHSWKLQFGVI